METILEIIKITLPALIVFLTIYFIMKSYLAQQYQLQLLSMKQKNVKHTIHLKLQAYERLMMLCERISIPNLILRLRTRDMNVEELTNSMILAIQQESNHNLTQQVYITDELWNIITLAKNETLNEISEVSKKLDQSSLGTNLVNAFTNSNELTSETIIAHAKKAIKQELTLHMV